MTSPHQTRAHAKLFSPSKADTWASCTASPKLIESLDIKDTSSDAAEEGTAAHELLERCLTEGKPPRTFKGQTFNKRFTADTEMIEAVDRCFQWVRSHTLLGYELKAERKLAIACTGDVGTTDITLWHPGDKHLVVADLKYGKGKVVDPAKNRQMRLYACGTCDADKLWTTMKRLTLVIWQPRLCEEAQEWEDSPAALVRFRNRIGEIVAAIKAGKTTFAPSETACRWCPAKGQCKAYATYSAQSMRLDLKQITSQAAISTPSCDALTVTELASIWEHTDEVMAWLKAVNARLHDLASNGRAPGYKIVEGKSNRAWTDEAQAAELLASLGLDPDEFAPRSLVSIAAAEKLLPATKRIALATLAHKPPGKPTLARDDDPRPSPVASMALPR